MKNSLPEDKKNNNNNNIKETTAKLNNAYNPLPEEDLDNKCDLGYDKDCDNCCKCLNEFSTDEKGYLQIKIDEVDSALPLKELYKLYGLDDD